MNYVTGQFVCLPRIFELNRIRYTDLMVYIAVRSFNNDENNCYPRYETIAKRAGCGRTYVIEAISRLEALGLIQVIRSNKIKVVNRYKFTESYGFEQIPYQLFDEPLTLNEKSMLLWLRQWVRFPRLLIPYKLKNLSKLLKIRYKIMYQQVSSLIAKGYVEKHFVKDRYFGLTLTDKIDWPIAYGRKMVVQNSPILVC